MEKQPTSGQKIKDWFSRNYKNILISLGIVAVVCIIWFPELWNFWRFIGLKPEEFTALGILVSQNSLGLLLAPEFVESLNGLTQYATIFIHYYSVTTITGLEVLGYWKPIYFWYKLMGFQWVTTAIIPHGYITHYATLAERMISSLWGTNIPIIPVVLTVGVNMKDVVTVISLFSGVFALWKLRGAYGNMATIIGFGLIALGITAFMFDNLFLLKGILIGLIGVCLMMLWYQKGNKFLSVTSLAITISPFIIYTLYQALDKVLTLGVSYF